MSHWTSLYGRFAYPNVVGVNLVPTVHAVYPLRNILKWPKTSMHLSGNIWSLQSLDDVIDIYQC